MAVPTPPKPLRFLTEDEVRARLYDSLLTSSSPNSLIVEKWSGYSVKTGKERRRQYLDREIDVAMFSLQVQPPITQLLTLGGLPHKINFNTYEVKGYTQTKQGKWIPPALGDGLDQALVHLAQNSDFSTLVYPDLGAEIGKKLADICTNFAPRIGVLFVSREGQYFFHKSPTEAPLSAMSEQQKRKMLSMLITGGTYSRIYQPEWAKKHLY
jgi:hypothetical protein